MNIDIQRIMNATLNVRCFRNATLSALNNREHIGTVSSGTLYHINDRDNDNRAVNAIQASGHWLQTLSSGMFRYRQC